MRSILALSFFVVLAVADCPTGGPDPRPNPAKCYNCQPLSGNRLKLTGPASGAGDSWTDFTCRYIENGIPNDPKNNPNKDKAYELLCDYNDQGSLIRTRGSGTCPGTAIHKANCQPDKSAKYTGAYERCCADGCKTETDKCLTCPKYGEYPWVEVKYSKDFLNCTYHYSTGAAGQVSTCNFNANTGKLIVDYLTQCPLKTVARQSEECLKKNPSVTRIDPNKDDTVDVPCPNDSMKAECEQEKDKGKYLVCPVQGPCETKNCWTCPKVDGTDYVQASSIPNPENFFCKYYKKGNPGDQYIKQCTYEPWNGKLLPTEKGVRYSDGSCPGQAQKNLKCARGGK